APLSEETEPPAIPSAGHRKNPDRPGWDDGRSGPEPRQVRSNRYSTRSPGPTPAPVGPFFGPVAGFIRTGARVGGDLQKHERPGDEPGRAGDRRIVRGFVTNRSEGNREALRKKLEAQRMGLGSDSYLPTMHPIAAGPAQAARTGRMVPVLTMVRPCSAV